MGMAAMTPQMAQMAQMAMMYQMDQGGMGGVDPMAAMNAMVTMGGMGGGGAMAGGMAQGGAETTAGGAAAGGMGGMGGGFGVDKRPGDWTCPNCSDNVFARNPACRKCGTARPGGAGGFGGGFGGGCGGGGNSQEMKPGDWNCPACNDLQFARNAVCRRCNTPKPAELDGVSARGRSR